MIDVSNFAITQLPTAINRISACYILFYHGQMVYIGETNNLLQRIQTHQNDKIFDEVRHEPVTDDKGVRITREKALIQEFRPILSGQYGGSRDQFVFIDDAVFTAYNRKSCYIDGNRLLNPQREHIGYIHGRVLLYFHGNEGVKHFLDEGRVQHKIAAGLNKSKPWHERYGYDEKHHKFFDKEEEYGKKIMAAAMANQKCCARCKTPISPPKGKEWRTLCWACFQRTKLEKEQQSIYLRNCDNCGKSFKPRFNGMSICPKCHGRSRDFAKDIIRFNVSKFTHSKN